MSDATRLRDEITTIINEAGEEFQFARGLKKIAKLSGAYGAIQTINLVPGQASPIDSSQKVIYIPVTTKYTPEVKDTVTDSAKNINQINSFKVQRYQGTAVAYVLTVT